MKSSFQKGLNPLLVEIDSVEYGRVFKTTHFDTSFKFLAFLFRSYGHRQFSKFSVWILNNFDRLISLKKVNLILFSWKMGMFSANKLHFVILSF